MEHSPTVTSSAGQDRAINIVDVAAALIKAKKIVIGLPIITALFAVGVALLLPSYYKATTRLMPPQQAQSSTAAMLAQLGAAGAMLSGSGLKNPSDLYIGMLKSRTIADKLIGEFKLEDVYKLDSKDEIRKVLAANTVVAAGKDGIITIEVEDRDKGLAARMAAAYVEELTKLTKVLAVTEASKRRLFFEQQLLEAKDNLASAEFRFKGSVDNKGVVSVDADTRAILETVAGVRAKISAKEVELNSMRSFVTSANPEYRRVEEELISLRSQLSKLENGSGQEATTVSRTGLDNIKILRDVKYYQMLYEMLTKQYEIARLDEAKDPSIIQVLDPAIEPERKSRPHRAVIVLVSTFIALLISILWALMRAGIFGVSMDEAKKKEWLALKSELMGR